MNFVNRVRNYLLEEEFTFQVYPNRIDVVNYSSIGHFDEHKVIIRYEGGELIVKGTNLYVSKLLNDEVLIEGIIENIELR